jgi:hypothetical protein
MPAYAWRPTLCHSRAAVQVSFTANLRRRRPAPVAEAEGATVREVLDRVLGDDPLLRGYVLDEQGRLRRHVNVFVGGRGVADRRRLSDPVGPRDDIHVPGRGRRDRPSSATRSRRCSSTHAAARSTQA